MKVRCVRLEDSFGREQDSSPWLTLGKIYHVLALTLTRGEWFVRLMGDEPNGLALFPMKLFEIASPQVPSSWIAVWKEDGFFTLTPEPWHQPGFWEAYYNMEPEAIQIFENERKKIVICAD